MTTVGVTYEYAAGYIGPRAHYDTSDFFISYSRGMLASFLSTTLLVLGIALEDHRALLFGVRASLHGQLMVADKRCRYFGLLYRS